jgi:hypothetical protein
LDRDHGAGVGDVSTADGAAHTIGVRGVGHDVERVVVHPPHNDVVEHRRVVVEQVRVLGSPDADLAEVVGERRLQPRAGVGPRDPHRAEVTDVERDSVGAARQMLGERARRVRERHRPASEVDELGTEVAMLLVEWRAARLAHEPGRAGVSSMPNRWTRAA